MLSQMPLVSVALALTPHPILAGASWMVTLALLSPCRTITYALTEPTIALYRDEASLRLLRKFATGVGLLSTGIVLVAAATGFDMWFFQSALNYSREVATIAHAGLVAASLTPVITAQMMYVRGVLTAHHVTFFRLLSIGVGVVALMAMLTAGVALRLPGPIMAGSSLS